MARKLFEKQGIRTRAGALATGTVFVVYTDSAGTTLADISATSGGSAIAGSTVTVTDRAGLGLATLLFYGPTDGTDTLYLRCPADTGLGVQEIEADEDERLDALVVASGIPPSTVDAKGDLIAGTADNTVSRLAAGANDTVLTADSSTGTGLKWAATGAHPNLATHDALGLATDAELATHAAAANPHSVYATDTDLSTHEADTTAIHGIADTSALATTSGVTSAVSTHAGLADPHTGYVLESLYDAKGDLLPASADNTPAKLTVGANDTVLTADSAQASGLKWATPAAAAGTAGGDLSGTYPNPQIGTGVIVNADVNGSAAIARAKLDFGSGLVNADIAAAAGIVKTKLAALGIVNADVDAAAAVVYSKLNLATSIVNADIAVAAAIAYSKLNLTGAILNADLAGSIALTKLAVGVVEAQGGGKETFQAHGAMGSTETFDLANGNLHTGTLDAACTFTFSGSTASKACSMTLILTQNGTGGFAITWPASVDWPGGAAPPLSTAANKVSVLTFLTVDNGTTWLGFLAGDDLR